MKTKLFTDHNDTLAEIKNMTMFRKTIEYLWDGNIEAFNCLYFVQMNYKESISIFNWLVKNEMRGKKLVELFQNESPDGGGYHMGVTYILSRMKGKKHNTEAVKIDELR